MDEQAGERNPQSARVAQAPHWELWFMWVLSSLAAGVVTAVLVYVGWANESVLIGVLLMFGIVLVPGFVLGALQFLVLRRHVAVGRTWIPITALGWALGLGARLYRGHDCGPDCRSRAAHFNRRGE